jgi:hypothetical protein
MGRIQRRHGRALPAQNREMLPTYDGTDELSREFARSLFSMFPAWEGLARIVNDEKMGGNFIELDVKQAGTDRLLHLSTADAEMTIGFEHWHTHVGPFLGIDTVESVATAMNIVEDFVAERTVVKIVHRDGVWIRSSLEYLVAPGEPEPRSTTKVFSWRRTYDAIIEIP